MKDEPSICAVCAWRETCRKRFNYSSSTDLRCPDYCRDLRIKKDEDKEDAES